MARLHKKKKSLVSEDGIKVIAQNRRARYDYHTIDTWEAGIQLQGTEVKSLRDGKANLSDSYARLDGAEVFLHNVHIGEYDKGNQNNHEPTRTRKLLLHRHEIRKLQGSVEEKGLTLIPLKLYFKRGRAKVEIALAKGKREYDRRQDIAQRDARRDTERALKERTLERA
jgi:SsrA-binding protein